MEVSGQLHTTAALPSGNEPSAHFYKNICSLQVPVDMKVDNSKVIVATGTSRCLLLWCCISELLVSYLGRVIDYSD